MFDDKLWAHFVGIGGIGMSGLAQLLREMSCRVSGSDRDSAKPENQPLFSALKQLGIEIYPQDGSYSAAGTPDLIIYSTAVESGNPDFAAAGKAQLLHRSKALAAAMQEYAENGTSIAVTGSAGKTSVTAYLAELLDMLAGDAGCLDGGMVKRFASGGHPGNFKPGRNYWVFEADESDKSLLNYQVDYAIILNIGCDHYSEDELSRVFGEFTRHIRKGLVTSREVFRKIAEWIPSGLKVVLVDYPGTPDSDNEDSIVTVSDYHISGNHAKVLLSGHMVDLPQPGVHTAVNIAMVAAMCRMLGFEWNRIVPLIGEVSGVARRFDLVGSSGGISIYDDYAHNPQKLCCCLNTAQSISRGKVIMIWQPHGYGPLGFMREELGHELQNSLRPQDIFILLEPFYAGGTSAFKPHADEVIETWHNTGILPNAVTVASREAVEELVKKSANPGDIILVCGARDNSLPGWAEKLVEQLSARTS